MFSSSFFLLGSSLASFFTCQLYRSQHPLWAFKKRSFCENCQQTLRFWQLIPIIGFIFQRGHCYFCHARIDPESTLNEFFLGIIMSLIALLVPQTAWLQALFLCSWLFYLSLFDLATKSIPVNPLLLGGLLSISFASPIFSSFELLFFSICLSLLLLGNIFGKLGLGDTLVISFLALNLSPEALWLLLLCASLATLLYALFFKTTQKLAFVPALFLGYLMTLFN